MGDDRVMLRVAIRHVDADQVEVLRAWFAEVSDQRRAEALATLIDEGCRHEQAILIEGRDGPVLVYVMEVDDVTRSIQAVAESEHAIDADHQRVMREVLRGPVPAEVVLDLRP